MEYSRKNCDFGSNQPVAPARGTRFGSVSSLQRHLLHGNGIDRTNRLAAATADALALVDPQSVGIQRIGLALLDTVMPGNAALVVAYQAGDLDDATIHWSDIKTFVAQNAFRVDDLKLVVAQVATG